MKIQLRIILVLLLFADLHVSAAVYSQTVSFSGKDVPLQNVFASIEKQTGVSFFFNYTLIKDAKPITLNVRNISLEEMMTRILEGQDLDFYRTGKTIFIVKKRARIEVASPTENGPDDRIDIRGKVTDSAGFPLVGATISVKNLAKGSVTNEKGVFEIKNVPVGASLVISYTGYQSRVISVKTAATVNVELLLADNILDETQIIAYGRSTRRFIIGNIGGVKSEEIERQPVANPLLTLQGRVSGIFISQPTGLAGSGVAVRIQGQNSMTKGNDPFYVVDGVPYTSQLLPSLSSTLGGSGTGFGSMAGNPLAYLNPADIESIEVLKDADATAIYGSRAANGAILITTKRGKNGQSKFDVNAQEGFGKIGHRMKLLNTQQYLQMRHEALQNDGSSTKTSDYDINGTWDTTRNTDWQKALTGNAAKYTDIHASLSGGNTTTQYLLGGGFHRETTIFPGNFYDQSGSLHFSLHNVSSNQRLHTQLSANYMVDHNLIPNGNLLGLAISMAPDAPALHNADGSLNWAPTAAGSSTWSNPLSANNQGYTKQTNNLISSGNIEYNILPGLALKADLGYTNMQYNETTSLPLTIFKPELRSRSNRSASYGINSITSWIVEPQATYKRNLWKGKLDLLVGATVQQNNTNGTELRGTGYTSDQVLNDIKSATTVTVLNTVANTYRYSALFGRIGYNLQDKYLFNLTGRRDGSSRFGTKNQFHNFGSAGLAWIFSSETWVKNALHGLSFGKLRASYGTTGNDQIGDYQFLNLYTPVSVSVPYQTAAGLAPNALPNPYLQWEETQKLQLGIDLGLFNDRILVSATWFRNRSSNQLLPYALPIITGFSGITENFPATVQNTGLEATLTTTNIKTRNFSWSTYGTLTLPKNKLVAFPNLATSSYATTLVIGKPISIIRAFHFLGVDPTTGVYQFMDSQGKATFSPDGTTDLTVMVNTAPTCYGGVGNTFGYKGVNLDVFFQFVKQRGTNYFFGHYPGSYNYNQPVWVLDRWQHAGQLTAHQQYNANFNWSEQADDALLSDAGYGDASFIRLKNISLSWQLPKQWIKGARMQEVQLYAHAQNVITWTNYKGTDPETLNSASVPPLRVITFGIKAGF